MSSFAARTVLACLSATDVRALFDGSMDDATVEQVDAHVAECDACRKRVADFARQTVSVDDPTELSAETNVSGLRPFASLLPMAEALVRRKSKQRIGTVFAGKWTLEGLLGEGGMARVYAAVHANGRKVAIKILKAELAEDVEVVRRFLLEAHAANRVDHPNVVAVLDNDVDEDGTPYLVMERLDGETLRARLDRGPVSVDEARTIGCDLLDALEVAHARGIVHRDIKPENVFLVRNGAAKLLDFGIARVHSLAAQRDGTRSGVTIGTPAYMAPEQARGESSRIGVRTDLWALGATLFSAVTRSTVHASAHGESLLFHAMTAKAPPLRSLLPGAPKAFALAVDRALAFEPDDRFADAVSMRQALRDEPTEPAARASDRISSRKSRSSAALAVAGVVALGLGYASVAALNGRRAEGAERATSSLVETSPSLAITESPTSAKPLAAVGSSSPAAVFAASAAPQQAVSPSDPAAALAASSSEATSKSSPAPTSRPSQATSPSPARARSTPASAASTASRPSAAIAPLPSVAPPPVSPSNGNDDPMLRRRH